MIDWLIDWLIPFIHSFIHVTVVQLATEQKVKLEHARLYLDASEAMKEFTGRYFGKELYFDYTHLVCRTALNGNKACHLFNVIFLVT